MSEPRATRIHTPVSTMTKTEARAYLTRIRQGARDAEAALVANDGEALYDALMEISGSAGTIESALSDAYGDGSSVGGITRESW
jgi:protein subunit release factor A